MKRQTEDRLVIGLVVLSAAISILMYGGLIYLMIKSAKADDLPMTVVCGVLLIVVAMSDRRTR